MSTQARRGRPKGAGLTREREALMVAVWRVVQEEMIRGDARNVSDACRRVIDRRPRGIIIKDTSGATIANICDADKLRQWFYRAQRALDEPGRYPALAARATQIVDAARRAAERRVEQADLPSVAALMRELHVRGK